MLRQQKHGLVPQPVPSHYSNALEPTVRINAEEL